MRFFFLLILFSGVVNALTTTQLIKKYGKNKVVHVIYDITQSKNLTFLVNGSIMKAAYPDLKYVNARTISIDLKAIDITPMQVAKILSDQENKLKKEAEIKANKEKAMELHLIKKAQKLERYRLEAAKQPFDEIDRAVCDRYQNNNLKLQCYEELNGTYQSGKEASKYLYHGIEQKQLTKYKKKHYRPYSPDKKTYYPSPSKTESYRTYLGKDQKSYDTLRSKGYSESESRKSAAGLRRLCEAFGGGPKCR